MFYNGLQYFLVTDGDIWLSKIDEVDEIIISTLLFDARTSFAEIGRLSQKSTNTIRTRYNKLKKDGVITGATIQLNPKILGYECTGQILIHTDFKEEKNLCKNLLKIKGVLDCSFQVGEFNYVVFFALESFKDLDDVVNKINHHKNIKRTSVDLHVGTVTIDHPNNLNIKSFFHSINEKTKSSISNIKQENYQGNRKYKEKKLKLDKIDLEIINLLLKDARLSFRKIAKKLSVSNQLIIKKYNRLQKIVIQKSTITISLEKMGYIGIAIFAMKLSNIYPAPLIFEEVLAIKNVIIAYRTLGDFQIIAGVPFKKMVELESYFLKISKTRGVIEVQLFFPRIFPEWPVNIFSKI